MQAKIVGRRGPALAPLELDLKSELNTVRDLLVTIVRQQVEVFGVRKQDAKFLRVLTERDIDDGQVAGKILSRDQEPDARRPDVAQSIEAAITAFEDGLYYIFVNDAQVEKLEQPVEPREVKDVLFVRLTPLAGG